MSIYTFRHKGRPKPKERPRTGRFGRIYTPKRTLDAEAELAASYDGPFFKGPVQLVMTFSPSGTTITVEDWEFEPSPLRGDVDNYLKLPLDALQGVAYANDRQVMCVAAQKVA